VRASCLSGRGLPGPAPVAISTAAFGASPPLARDHFTGLARLTFSGRPPSAQRRRRRAALVWFRRSPLPADETAGLR